MYINGIIDTHSHYDDEHFSEDMRQVLLAQKEHGIAAIIENSCDFPSIHRTLKMVQDYDFVYGAVGIHPQWAEDLPEDWLTQIADFSRRDKIVAIGEIGLDYHYPTPTREVQQSVYHAQLALSKDLGLPVEVHDRDAHGDILSALQKYRPSGCVHRFSGSVEMAREVIKLGMVIGIGGALTYSNSKKERAVVEDTSLEHIILETDCPYLAPQYYRRQRCTSDMLWTVAQLMAEIKGETPEKIVEITSENARRVFGI